MTAPALPAVQFRVDVGRLDDHHFDIAMELADAPARLTVSLPVWIPGSYLVREFSRHLSGLSAERDGRPARLTPLDKHRWAVEAPGSGPLRLRYRVYAFDNSVRSAWLDRQRGFFNGSSLFLSAEGFEEREQQVRLDGLPSGWEVATGLPGTVDGGWCAPNYDNLIDHPFELGPFWRGRFEACGVSHEFVVAGAPPGFDGERLLADTRRICEAQLRFWHGEAPACFDRYVFLLNAVDDGYGGLEHRNSTALICNRRDLPRRIAAPANGSTPSAPPASDGYVTLLGLISHEYFHTWNVKRLKPAEFAPYRLDAEQYTELLWFFEGFTSYYDDLFLLRAGLVDEARYLKLLAKNLNQVLGSPGRAVQSVAEASFDAWIKYYRPDENSANATVSYYTKGSLVALALDLTLRGEDCGDLDAVMRRLWQVASERSGSAGGPITEADIAEALQAVAGRSLAPVLAAWVHGRNELPLQALLQRGGVRWNREAPTLAQRLGARLQEAPGGPKVQAVLDGGLAATLGLAAGDELLALGGWRLAKVDDLTLYGAFDAEQPQSLLVSRDRRLLSLVLPAMAGTVEGAVSLTVDPQPDPQALQRRARWWSRTGA
ncbi:MAG: M61 family metallopeptidase [Leptothrix sp. (in: Bacteria)]|jgi:predicted metalloprotease with PDZ domain|nr:M61 family metallopeptidase [Leptothrix sp. (in: b-proteobacteria)]HQY07187.1 peptidase M61 [Burkholderiaceae bacterium]